MESFREFKDDDKNKDFILLDFSEAEGLFDENEQLLAIFFHFSTGTLAIQANDTEVESFIFFDREEKNSFLPNLPPFEDIPGPRGYFSTIKQLHQYKGCSLGWVWYIEGYTGYEDAIQFNLYNHEKKINDTIQVLAMVYSLDLYILYPLAISPSQK